MRMWSRETKVMAAAAAVVIAIGIAVAAVVIGGGGGSSNDEYEGAVVDARDRVDFALAQIGQSTSPEELIERIDQAGKLVDRVADDLSKEAPSGDLEDENDKLVKTLRAFSVELTGTAATFADPAFAASLPGIRDLSFPQWEAVNRVLVDLKKQGIEVEPLARH
jgi:hypothetical protein